MFTRRGHGDVKKSIQKVLDPKKDVLTRLKHLRSMLDIIDRGELKTFFESNCSQIYFIFYENFTTLESSLKQKGNKSQREELDSILFIFEVSQLDFIVSPVFSSPIRCEGIRLFLLWLQALRDNCAEEQFLIFACLVPGFPAVPSSRGPCTLDTIIYNPFSASPDADRVVPEEITPLVPAVAGDKAADDQTCYILETLLKYMVIQASSLEWKNKENQDTGFRFLFSLFKKYYLPHLFPSFPKLTNLYKPVLDLPHHRPKPLYVPVTRNNESTFCTRDQYLAPRVAFISWLVTFFLEKKYVNSAAAAQSAKNGAEVIPKLIQVSVTVPLLDGDVAGPAGEPEKSHSNSSTLSDRRPSDSSLCSIEEEHRYVYEMVHAILLSTRENVNFVNEVFHQAFLLPSCEASATRKVIKVYRKWILQEKPNFMAEPDKNIHSHEVDSCEQTRSTEISIHIHGHRRTSSWGRTYSFSSAISRGFFTEERNTDVKTGIQPALQVFLTNSSNVFLLEPCQDVPKLLDNQVEVCKGVLSIYRHMIMEHTMDTQTWLQLLQVLLRVTEAVMKRPQENQKKDSFAQSLASILFRTIIVAWVRANLSVFISRELWDELLAVLSSLTYWEELVMEWANIMDSLTAVLARSVYGLDMANLPLDKLSEQKEKKQRGRGEVLQDSQKAAAVARSFSLSWRNQGEPGGPGVQEPMRIRSATTSGAPGVEKARNNVRQKASDVEECQLSECGGEEELGGGESPLPRSSSTSDITQQLSEHFPGNNTVKCLIFHSLNLILFSLLFLNARFSWACPARSRFELFVWWPATLNPALFDHADSSECLADDVSIIAGGTLTGWHADSAFVLWRRILGILGDVNNIRCPKIHAKVFSYLYELWHKLAKIRDNLGISVDNQSSPPRPVFIPPIRMLASWLFKATMLSDEYKAGKLQAYKLICEMMTRHQDVLPNSDFLVHLYHIMHNGINNNDQDVLNTIIRSCSSRFFFLGLPGFTLLVGDFITSSASILSSNSSEAPRVEAQTILGSLVCFPNVYHQIPLLQHVPASDDVIVCNEDIKDYLVNILLDTATKEHCEEARCIAVCSLGLWVCEELMQKNIHQQVTDAINVLGVTLKFGNKVVAQAACDVFQLLITHWERLQRFDQTMPKKIIEIFVATIAFLLPGAEHSTLEADKKLMVSLLLCLLDWCMAVPLSLLLEPITMSFLEDRTSHKAPLLDYIYRVLHCCVSGSTLHTQQSRYLLSLSDLSSDYDLMLGQVNSFEPPPSQTTVGEFGNLLTVAEEKRRRNMELIPLTARMVMTHLVNHLGHHPLRGGPALLHSLLSENHDNPYVESSELSSEVFKSPNLQLFVFNDSTLVSYLQIPSESHTVGRPPQPSYQVRVIVRDISGKYSWDGAILYCTSQDDPTDVGVFNEPDPPLSTSSSKAEVDVLDKLLECLGQCSPECLPHAQLRLNQPAPSPNGMNLEQESSILEAILRQTQQEEKQVRTWDTDVSFRATCQGKPSQQEPKAPFYFCRLLLNDLGMNSWDRRKSFHLLKKNSKLLRELKNLDSRQCRETHKFAVFYIGEGQEDKCSILSNSSGSQAFEDFVSGLGWEVDLATHCGFMGGLQRNGSTGLTAPYYATSTVEAIFHVSTRMPSDSDDCLTKKLRHLGNDEVHIVWSEHTRDYRPGIIPTDFGDVLIIIYPMKNHMYFIQIVKKPQVPFFGPLFNGAIITGTLLPSLVRATCINASRAVKSRLTLYQSFYEERALYLDAIVQNHREVVTFEDFASQVFSPSPGYPMSGTGEKSSPPPPPPVTSLLQVASILAVRSEPSHLSSCHPFFTSSTSATPIYLCLTPGCRRWPMNIKRGRSDRLQTRCRLLLNPPSCCCVGLFLFANCYFDCNYFPYEYKEAF
uniref:Ral GTPase activating protein catalytic subunit alpha 2 n=1 Tax=Takifugu rubripes TaxID=31033 RepID=H2SYW2_TAKRU